jgi:hypothetical protein
MTEPTVIEWDATHLPAELRALLPSELRDLPPGRYVIEPMGSDDELTLEEEEGILAAIREIEAGKGILWEDALRALMCRTSELATR